MRNSSLNKESSAECGKEVLVYSMGSVGFATLFLIRKGKSMNQKPGRKKSHVVRQLPY
jgi:hypothetical protein